MTPDTLHYVVVYLGSFKTGAAALTLGDVSAPSTMPPKEIAELFEQGTKGGCKVLRLYESDDLVTAGQLLQLSETIYLQDHPAWLALRLRWAIAVDTGSERAE